MFSVNYIAGETVIQQGVYNNVYFHLPLITSITMLYNMHKQCMITQPNAHARLDKQQCISRTLKIFNVHYMCKMKNNIYLFITHNCP